MPMEDELDDWFMVLLGPWGRQDQPDADPAMAEIPRRFLHRLRENAPEWRRFGVEPDDTIGCYEDERLRVGFEFRPEDEDEQGEDQVGRTDGAHDGDHGREHGGEQPTRHGVLRVEFSARDWQAAWADPSEGITAPTMIEARPGSELVGGPIVSSDGDSEIDEALDWIRTQLSEPAG